MPKSKPFEQARLTKPMKDNMSSTEDLYQNIDDFVSVTDYLNKTRSENDKSIEKKFDKQTKEESNNIKKAYFQGGGGANEPTPKKKKYKSDRALVMQPRFKEPLYHNYDLYETEGVDGPAKQGPGTGFYQNMDKYDSVSDFRSKKDKRNKGRFESKDMYKEDDGSLTYSEKKRKMIDRRAKLFYLFFKQAIDFAIDDQIKSDPILGDSGTVSDSVPIGGQLDEYLPEHDFEGKDPTSLNFGRDYTENEDDIHLDRIKKILESYKNNPITPKETDIFGLPQGVDPPEDLDNPDEPSNGNPGYGTTDSGNNTYDNMWFGVK